MSIDNCALPKLSGLSYCATASLCYIVYNCVLHFLSFSLRLLRLILIIYFQMTQALNFLVRKITDLENNIVSVERTKEYSDLPNEV